MELEERIEKERDKNDGLACDIAKLRGESMADFKKSLPHGQYLQELHRQKKESDQRLASLRQQMQFSNETGIAVSSSHENKTSQKAGSRKDDEVAKRRALVRSNPNLSAKEMCELFDRKNVQVAGSRISVLD